MLPGTHARTHARQVEKWIWRQLATFPSLLCQISNAKDLEHAIISTSGEPVAIKVSMRCRDVGYSSPILISIPYRNDLLTTQFRFVKICSKPVKSRGKGAQVDRH